MLARIFALVLLVLLAASGWWVWARIAGVPWVRPVPEPTPSLAPTVTPTSTATPLRPPPGYRLAGIAVGSTTSYAVIEAPGGRNVLYRVGEQVPGLGRLASVEAERVVIEGAAGQFLFNVAPAATPTRSLPTPEPAEPMTPTPKPLPPGDESVPGSWPSDAPDRPVS